MSRIRRPAAAVLALVTAATLPACAVASPPFQAVPGVLYSDMTGPGHVTAAEVGARSGVAMAESYLGLYATGDASIAAAAAAGGVHEISHVDYKAFSLLGIYARVETYVYGN